MDRRQQRIQKIVNALLEENISSGQSDDDFEEVNIITSIISTSTENSNIEEDEEELQEQQDEKKQLHQENRNEQIKRIKKYIDPAFQNKPKDISNIINQTVLEPSVQTIEETQSNVSNTQIFSQFKLTDEQWTQHLAVTHAWNIMAYKKSVTQTSIQAQEVQNTVIQNNKQAFIQIQGDSRRRVYLAYLDVIFNNIKLATFVIENFEKQTTADDFYKLQESKQLPDDFDYQRQLESFYRQTELQPGVKQAIFDNKKEDFSQISSQKINQNTDFQLQLLDCEKQINTDITSIPQLFQQNLPITILNIPAKRGFLNKFYLLTGNPPQPVPGVLSVQIQTDQQLKIIKNVKKQNIDDTITFIIIDQKEYDLAPTSMQQLMDKITVCTTLRIIRGRGRSSRKLSDLLDKIRFYRPDLLEEDVFSPQKPKQISGVEYKAPSLTGTFSTLQGLYDDAKTGEISIVDNAVQEMRILEPEIIDFQFSNDVENWCFRWLPYCEKVVRIGKKYFDPVSQQGFDNLDEFRLLRGKEKGIESESQGAGKRQKEQKKGGEDACNEQKQPESEDIEESDADEQIQLIQNLIDQGDFEGANKEYQLQLQDVSCSYLQSNPLIDENLDVVEKILGSHRYCVLD